jgi:hypothetical protein
LLPVTWKQEAEQWRSRVAALDVELCDAGLSDPAARTTLFKALAGRPFSGSLAFG